MFYRSLITTLALTTVIVATPSAQVPMAPDVDLTVSLDDLGNGQCMLNIATEGEIGSATLLTFGFSYDEMMNGPGPIHLLLPAELRGQRFKVQVPEAVLMAAMPTGLHAPNTGVFTRNFFIQHGKIVGTEIANIMQSQGSAVFEDFASLTPGQMGPIDVGLLHITCVNNDGPDTLVVFDSANPTGGDGDLITPGYGHFNTIARGNLLAIAENVDDSEPDGLVDDPDDDKDGGTVFIEFATTVTFFQAQVIDADPGETWVARWYFGDILLGDFDIDIADPSLKDDNGVFALTIPGIQLDRVEVDFGSSGAIATIVYNSPGQ